MKSTLLVAVAGLFLASGTLIGAGDAKPAPVKTAEPPAVVGANAATKSNDKKPESTEARKQAAVKKIVNDHLLFEIGRDNPEQAKKLEALSKQDPEAFAKAIDDYAHKSSEAKKQKTEEFRHLVEEYLLNPSEQLKTQIKAQLAEVYDRKISWEKGQIARQQEKLRERQEKLKKIEAERDTLIDEQFEKITQWQW